MNWYYVDQGQQAGPVTDAQLEELVRSGKIQPNTLFWREGMANWQAYREVHAPTPVSAPPPPLHVFDAAQTLPASAHDKIRETQR